MKQEFINDEYEKALSTTFRMKIWSRFVKALKEYQLLSPGDKVCVCISGGKDSMLMAKLFMLLQKHSDFDFEVKWLEDICSHMNLDKHLRGHWTKENCHKVALLCQSRTEFSKKYPSAAEAASKNGWMNEICQHMESSCKPNGYWNIKQNCLIESKK